MDSSDAAMTRARALIEKVRDEGGDGGTLVAFPYESLLELVAAMVERGAIDPIPMLLWCPFCRLRHIDKGEFATKVHHTHACQGCGHVWRPAVLPTVGVQYLPGFKDPAS